MDKITRGYRQTQIEKINNGDFKYNPKLKMFGGETGNTNYLDITKVEYIAICKILTDKI